MPTEAQWEYACRAGTETAYAGSGRLDEMGWCDDNSGGKTHVAGGKQPNEWGLYDMHGNVFEWCRDWRDDYAIGGATDPVGTSSDSYLVYRGGSW
ncbi:MAG TPA: SUMF1/EgtB/PvdO family nonheme iron enzyme, partial [Bacteroidia bacterium]|nr:SUMF1/EgtB/PvdO family nonheme iron enzyme [Bacteroidia bacterium]